MTATTATTTPAPIGTFDRGTIIGARKAIEDALAALNLGFEVKLGRITYGRDTFRASLDAKLSTAVATEKSAAQSLLETVCRRYGIDPMQKPVIPGTGEVELLSYNSRAPKYPWCIKHPNGQIYRYTTDMVILYWNGKPHDSGLKWI